jgi:hypothetical protein
VNPKVTTLKERGMPKKEKKDVGLSKSELDLGTAHEAEHADTFKEVAKDAKAGNLKPMEHYQRKTAITHLRENPKYYTQLKKLEGTDASSSDPESEIEDRPIA